MKIIDKIKERCRWYQFRKLCWLSVEKIINADVDGKFTQFEIDVIGQLIEHIQPDANIERKGKVIYTLPSLKEVTIFQVQKCRELMNKGLDSWLSVWLDGTSIKLTKIGDVIKAKKYIRQQLDIAYRTEQHLFGGGGESDSEEDALSVPIATINLIKIIADFKGIDFDTACKEKYENALLILVDYDRKAKKNSRPS